jgi:hypothetical protein
VFELSVDVAVATGGSVKRASLKISTTRVVGVVPGITAVSD